MFVPTVCSFLLLFDHITIFGCGRATTVVLKTSLPQGGDFILFHIYQLTHNVHCIQIFLNSTSLVSLEKKNNNKIVNISEITLTIQIIKIWIKRISFDWTWAFLKPDSQKIRHILIFSFIRQFWSIGPFFFATMLILIYLLIYISSN